MLRKPLGKWISHQDTDRNEDRDGCLARELENIEAHRESFKFFDAKEKIGRKSRNRVVMKSVTTGGLRFWTWKENKQRCCKSGIVRIVTRSSDTSVRCRLDRMKDRNITGGNYFHSFPIYSKELQNTGEFRTSYSINSKINLLNLCLMAQLRFFCKVTCVA